MHAQPLPLTTKSPSDPTPRAFLDRFRSVGIEIVRSASGLVARSGAISRPIGAAEEMRTVAREVGVRAVEDVTGKTYTPDQLTFVTDVEGFSYRLHFEVAVSLVNG